MKRLSIAALIIASILIVPAGTLGCGGDRRRGETTPVSPPTESTAESTAEPVVITIGNITDQTGVMSSGLAIVDMALRDMVAHYNEHQLIPGAEFQVVHYDTQYDPARNMSGYEYLLQQGADVFFTLMSSPPTELKDQLEADNTVMFAGGPLKAAVEPPGRVFVCGRTLAEYEVLTLLDWVARNDPGFPQGRPAKIGAAFTIEPYGEEIINTIRAYAEAHPDLYEWTTGYMGTLVFDWTDKIENFMDCDYLFPPLEFSRFATQYRNAGGEATLLGSGYHTGFLQSITDARAWDEIDGMLIVNSVSWWNEEGEEITLARDLLMERHPDKADKVIEGGAGYLASFGMRIMLETIGDTVDQAGPDGFSPERLFQTAQSFAMEIDGSHHSFSETKRTSPDELAIYEVRATENDLFRAHEGWIPIVYEP